MVASQTKRRHFGHPKVVNFLVAKEPAQLSGSEKQRTPHDDEHPIARDKEKNHQPTEKKVVERLSHGSEKIIHSEQSGMSRARTPHGSGQHRNISWKRAEQERRDDENYRIGSEKTGKKKSKKNESHLLRENGGGPTEASSGKLSEVIECRKKTNLFRKKNA